MNTAALVELDRELGGQLPDAVSELGEGELRVLLAAVRAERAARAAGLGEAAEEALKLVPAIARGPVRRILFK